ncbi:Thiol-disulfide isomerase or thioredoxin [Halanaeroarchaeum sp. HSR-CO]|uniref:thioredoxin family protein n=1 Tax=Halanaeroarchaeum sp. HSR-CO TaxID=2866382 RepID=UPI00217D22E0|nr:thioredoxin family protein [Halanaeroarchaeum sp. HSR-CO]UWG47629.1 Thiol-disulfide isomerase or thioredoxin [Halanaeroarchaeum sp. HSR-CO]
MAEESIQELSTGDPAPEFSLPGTDGETYTLSSFEENDALLVVFTCNHCPYAKAKIDVLNRLAGDYDEVAVVGINPNDETAYPDDSFERMRELVEDETIQYDAYLRDEDQTVATEYGAVCTPDPFLFRNDDGEFVLAWQGRLDDALNPDDEPSQHDMREAIEQVLAGRPVDKAFLPSRGCSIKWRD